VGDRFIKIQGFVIVPLMLSSSALLVVLTHRPFLYRLALVPIAALIIAFPNVMATLMWGRYLLRRKRAGMRSNLMVVGAASVILLFSGYDYVPKSTRAPSERVCRSFLKQIDMAKTEWATQEHKTTNDTPTDAQLFGPNAYLSKKPECPEGGIYTLRRVGEKPTCSVKGRTM